MAIKGSWPASKPELTTLLFDLDGTLVGMRKKGLELRFMMRAVLRFTGVIAPWRFRKVFWEAAREMQANSSDRTNYQVFLESLGRHSRKSHDRLDRVIRDCIERDFGTLHDRFYPIPGARETLEEARQLGYRLVVATNPVFPRRAVEMRMSWGGIGDIPFHYVTNSEVMTRCKPRTGFYTELLERLETPAEACIMVGNDPVKDLPAHDVGIPTMLLDFEEVQDDIAAYQDDPRLDGWGSFDDLRSWLRNQRGES